MQRVRMAGQKIKSYLGGIFRYRLGAVYMLVGYILSFVVVFNGISIYLSARDALHVVKKYQYVYETEMEVASDVPVQAYVEAAKGLSCNVAAKDVLLFSDEENVTKCVQVVLHSSEGEPQTGCVIGDALERYVVQRDGKRYYSLEGELYEVSEVIEGKDSELSFLVSIPYEMLQEAALRAMEDHFMLAYISLESNVADTNEAKSQLDAALSDLTGNQIILRRIPLENEQEMDSESRLGLYLCVCAYIFCIVNCIIVCEFWIFQRRKEIAVRRAYHFGDERIKKMLFLDMMGIIAVACVIYLALHGLVLSRLMTSFDAHMVLDIRSILFMLGMIPVSAGITILPYMRRLKKRSYAAGIRGV